MPPGDTSRFTIMGEKVKSISAAHLLTHDTIVATASIKRWPEQGAHGASATDSDSFLSLHILSCGATLRIAPHVAQVGMTTLHRIILPGTLGNPVLLIHNFDCDLGGPLVLARLREVVDF